MRNQDCDAGDVRRSEGHRHRHRQGPGNAVEPPAHLCVVGGSGGVGAAHHGKVNDGVSPVEHPRDLHAVIAAQLRATTLARLKSELHTAHVTAAQLARRSRLTEHPAVFCGEGTAGAVDRTIRATARASRHNTDIEGLLMPDLVVALVLAPHLLHDSVPHHRKVRRQRGPTLAATTLPAPTSRSGEREDLFGEALGDLRGGVLQGEVVPPCDDEDNA
mmetsp:Transcript_138289/g.350511  ORF Transcript_138289/g.350511 Transcript_138289/m.350511 type:complete len:217 (-) Transcript_138289:2175-2825(-)